MPSESVPCPGCGASVAPTGTCPFCGATAFLEGVAGKLLPSDLRCPRCPGEEGLRGLEHEGIRAEVCMRCHGVWFGQGLLEEAIRTAVKRSPLPGEGAEGPAHGGVEPVHYARCPVCRGGMSRFPLAQKPLVIIDRCPAHGDWCDGGELGQLQAVARSRGMAALGPPANPGTGAEPRGVKARSGVDMEALRAGRREWGRRGTPDLFDILWDLFTT